MGLTRPSKSQTQPHRTKRRSFAFLKSGFRLGACFALAYYELQIAAILFAVAEIIGMGEELV